MRSTLRLTFTTATLLLVLMLSAVLTVPVYADDGTPPQDVPAETQPEEPPVQDAAEVEAAPQTPSEPASVIEEIPAADTVESILAEVPQDTEVIVLDEEGNTVPLATEEAAQTITNGDPQWCPVGVTPGNAACTPARTTFSDMLNDLSALNGGAGPNMAGVIWIHKDYNSNTAMSDIFAVDDAGVPNFTLDGAILTNMANFALTIKGGWTGTGTTILIGDSSEFINASLNIFNWKGDVTISDITISGNSTGAQSLWVTTTGNITTTRVVVQGNSAGGAWLRNNIGSSVGNVTVTDSQFNNNTNTNSGLAIGSFGMVTLKNVIANGNGSGTAGSGVEIGNYTAVTPKTVTLTNVTTLNNRLHGTFVWSKGAISVTTITANGNGIGFSANGAQLRNDFGTAPVTLAGTNEFSNNSNTGLLIQTKDVVTVSNAKALGNAAHGIDIENNFAVTAKAVTLNNITTSTNQTIGLYVTSNGLITGTDLTAINNGLSGNGYGAYLYNAYPTFSSGITLNGTNLFFSNDQQGLYLLTNGAVKINNIQAVDNGDTGLRIDNASASTAQPVTLTGTNVFKFNLGNGLYITSDGQITLNNITASSNGYAGATLDNQTAPSDVSGVTLTGLNTFNDNANDAGLNILTRGAVTLANITANKNSLVGGSGRGVYIDNRYGITFKGVTFTGINAFNGNKNGGLQIFSEGIVSLSNITANDNQGFSGGVNIDVLSSLPAAPKAVTLSGTNTISNNNYSGLTIQTYGVITINSLTANLNGLVANSGYGANISNSYTNALTPANIVLSGTNVFNGNYSYGLLVDTLGSIIANNVTANNSVTAGGAIFSNNHGISSSFVFNSTGNITLTGVNTFTGNKTLNLSVASYGIISLNSVTASGSVSNSGAIIDNSSSATPKTITLSGNNVFSGNWNIGVSITSKGLITVNNLTASNNGVSGSSGYGANLNNSSASPAAGITLNGTNNFNNNYGTGLTISTLGAIKVNNLTASGSIGSNTYGAVLVNSSGAPAVASVMLTGSNTFNGNRLTNLTINSAGTVTISNLTANDAVDGYGAVINNTYSTAATPKAVTLTGINTFIGNENTGLYLASHGVITTNTLTATGNGTASTSGKGVYLNNYVGGSTIIPAGVTMNGINTFSGNYSISIHVETLGAILASNVTASGTINHYGAAFTNNYTGAVGNVTFTGVNTFNGNNGEGLSIYSKGLITISNLTANNNSGVGIRLDNNSSGIATPKAVTITGFLTANGNTSSGVLIYSYGAITTINVTAKNNTNNGVMIDQSGTTTPANLTMNGFNLFDANNSAGLYILSLGTVTLSNVTSSNNNGDGAYIYTAYTGGTGAVILNGTNTFTANTLRGLILLANGAVTLNNINASSNLLGGANIENTSLGTAAPRTVKLTGTNSFNNNGVNNGLDIETYGAVTLNNITASGNTGGSGAVIGNHNAVTPAAVTLTGVNQFNNNISGSYGLWIRSKGSIAVSNLTASNNANGLGAKLDNNGGTSTATVTLTGVNAFIENGGTGLSIDTNGIVNLTKVTADGNNQDGVYISANTSNVNLTCASITNNTQTGYSVYTTGLTTFKGVVVAGNGAMNVIGGSLVQTIGCPLP